MVAAVEMTESRLFCGGDVGGGDLGLEEADVATANAAAAVDVLLLDIRQLDATNYIYIYVLSVLYSCMDMWFSPYE